MSPALVHSISELRRLLAPLRAPGATIGCVPTMGALHEGHGRLIERARADCRTVVVTLFVNPIQFNRSDDLERYPRTLDTDLRFCEQRGVDFVFAPDAAEMFPAEPLARVDVDRLADRLCGPFRPGHFRGVATVVAKLFNIVQPDRAYFGEKDAQQLAVIERMTLDLNFPVTIVPVATVREADGLAMSSRNARLSPEQRRSAAVLYRALEAARERLAAGGSTAEQAEDAARAALAGVPDVRVEYLEIVDAEMQPVREIAGPVRIAIAAWIGDVRLIDNVLFEPR
ncbi:MAG: pantoate--beta-alanine ligase [Bryobacteraceae bacterium]|nr:pantoate--beta-alanine ligase [Bryobacteraceae bacterium]